MSDVLQPSPPAGITLPHSIARSFRFWTAMLLLIGFLIAGYRVWPRSQPVAVGPTVITDVDQLGRVLQTWGPTGLAGHFPGTVPSDATNVHFSAETGVYVQLRMQLPIERVRVIESKLKLDTTNVFAGGGMFHHVQNDKEDGRPTASFRTTDTPDNLAFPPYYILYVLKADDRSDVQPHTDPWTHGRTSGIAISLFKSEVVYWAESW